MKQHEQAATIIIPEWDVIEMRPKTKMPNCPVCEEDELGMLAEGHVFCYNCGLEVCEEYGIDELLRFEYHDRHCTD